MLVGSLGPFQTPFRLPLSAPPATLGSVFGARQILGSLIASGVPYAFPPHPFGLLPPTLVLRAISAIVAWYFFPVHYLGCFARFCSFVQAVAPVHPLAVLWFFLVPTPVHFPGPGIAALCRYPAKPVSVLPPSVRCWLLSVFLLPRLLSWSLRPLLRAANWWSWSFRSFLPTPSRWESLQWFG